VLLRGHTNSIQYCDKGIYGVSKQTQFNTKLPPRQNVKFRKDSSILTRAKNPIMLLITNGAATGASVH
jgi:hypothetical protein